MSLSDPPLATVLSAPITSTSNLLEHLVPALDRLGLLCDAPQLVARFGVPSSASTASQDALAWRRAFLKRQLGLVQKVIIEKVWLDWADVLDAEGEGDDGFAAGIALVDTVLRRWFVPARQDGCWATEIAISAYAVLLSLLSRRTSDLHPNVLAVITDLLARLSDEYGVKEIYLAIFAEHEDDDRALSKAASRWELVLKDVFAIPAKVANAWGAANDVSQIPPNLTWEAYDSTLAASFFALLSHLATSPSVATTSITYQSLALPLSHLNLLSPNLFNFLLPPLLPPPFPAAPDLLLRRQTYATLWRRVVAELSERDGLKFVRTFLRDLEKKLSASASWDGRERRKLEMGATWLLAGVFGSLSPRESKSRDDEDDATARLVLDVVLEKAKSWDPRLLKVVVGWIKDPDARDQVVSGRVEFMQRVLDAWADRTEIKDGTDQSRLHLTTLLLLTVNSLPPLHPSVVSLSRSPQILNGISAHLSLLRPTSRLLGMLVAEIVSRRTLPSTGSLEALSFGATTWEGEGEGKAVARDLRAVLAEMEESSDAKIDGWQETLRETWSLRQDAPRQAPPPPQRRTVPVASPPSTTAAKAPARRPLISVVNDPDDLQPYPLPPAPSDSYLSTLESEDASLYSTALPSGATTSTRRRGKLRAPVYIPELTAYLKGKDPEGKNEDAEEEAERVEVGLKEGEGLVRKKRGWGGELEENAVDLAFTLMGLQDNFDIEDFEQRKRAVLVALVAACPTKVAPAVIEQYFSPQYSIAQRYTMLASLALAARELAGLPAPSPRSAAQLQSPSPAAIDLFPSKRLPPSLHRRLIGPEDTSTATILTEPDTLARLSEDLANSALSDTKNEAETTIPLAAREKLLTVRRFASSKSPPSSLAWGTSSTSYPSVASEYFVLPLINRFWLYLQDASTSSSRLSKLGPYAGGPTSLVLLEPIVLSQFLSTLSIVLHAARHSPHFLAVLVPEAIELVLSLRTTSADKTEGTVLASEMEVLLVLLDASAALDGGNALLRSVSRGSEMVGEVKEWAEEVFEEEERRASEQGVGRAGRAAAGLLLRIDEMERRWRGTLGW